jgi:hypothetical protein
MKNNKISYSLKLNNQYDFALLCLLTASIYTICFVVFIGKAPIYDAFYEAKNWLSAVFSK